MNESETDRNFRPANAGRSVTQPIVHSHESAVSVSCPASNPGLSLEVCPHMLCNGNYDLFRSDLNKDFKENKVCTHCGGDLRTFFGPASLNKKVEKGDPIDSKKRRTDSVEAFLSDFNTEAPANKKLKHDSGGLEEEGSNEYASTPKYNVHEGSNLGTVVVRTEGKHAVPAKNLRKAKPYCLHCHCLDHEISSCRIATVPDAKAERDAFFCKSVAPIHSAWYNHRRHKGDSGQREIARIALKSGSLTHLSTCSITSTCLVVSSGRFPRDSFSSGMLSFERLRPIKH